MEPKAPEDLGNRNIVRLTNEYTHVLWPESVNVLADNIGASKWREMLDATDTDGKERGLDIYFNLLTRKFSTGEIFSGDKTSINIHEHALKPSVLIKSPIRRRVVNVHSHPLTEEAAHIKTVLPSGNDVRTFLANPDLSAMVVIGKGGAHLVLRSYHNTSGSIPDTKFIQEKIEEVAKNEGLSSDVQKQLNGMLFKYGLAYFYAENIEPSNAGIVVFKRP